MTVGETGNAVQAVPAPPRRRWIWWMVVAAAVMAVALAGYFFVRQRFAQPQYGIPIDDPELAMDFTLDSSLGTPLTLSDLRGKTVLLYFGYTTCPDVCPTTLSDLRQMMATLGEDRAKVQVLFVTVDPPRDTVEHMAAYLTYFDPSFVGLTGTPEQIEALASKYGVIYTIREGSSAAGYFIDHTSAVLAIDPEGRLRLMFPYGVTGDQMAADVSLLMQ